MANLDLHYHLWSKSEIHAKRIRKTTNIFFVGTEYVI